MAIQGSAAPIKSIKAFIFFPFVFFSIFADIVSPHDKRNTKCDDQPEDDQLVEQDRVRDSIRIGSAERKTAVHVKPQGFISHSKRNGGSRLEPVAGAFHHIDVINTMDKRLYVTAAIGDTLKSG